MSQPETVTSYLASRVTSSDAHQAILDSGQRKDLLELAKNPTISKEIWWRLAKTKSDSRLTFNLTLAPHILDDEQLRFLLKDRRTTINHSTFAHCLGSASPELAREILAKLQAKAAAGSVDYLAIAWLRSKTSPPDELIKPLMALTTQKVKLEIPIKHPHLFTTDDVIDLLNEKKEFLSATTLLWGIIDAFPAVAKRLAHTQDAALLEAVTGSRHLFLPEEFQALLDTLKAADYSSVSASSDSIKIYLDVVHLRIDALINLMLNPNAPPATRVQARDEVTRIYELQARATGSVYQVRRIDGLLSELISNRGATSRFDGRLDLPDSSPKLKEFPRLIQITQDWATIDETTWEHLNTDSASRHLLVAKRYPTLAARFANPAAQSSSKTEQKVTRPTLAQINASKKSGFVNISEEQVLQEIQKPLDAIGKDGWATFIAFAATWDEDIAALLDTAIAVSKAG